MPTGIDLRTRAAIPRWLHRWAALTVCATVVLLLLGSVVTTFRVGMADPLWPTYPWHLLLIDWTEPSAGFLIEHTHRAFGYLVGVLVIGLAMGIWYSEKKRHAPTRALYVALTAILCYGMVPGVVHELVNALDDSPQVQTSLLVSVLVGNASVLLFGLWRALGQRELRWLGVAVLAGIIIQGMLGGFRVRLNALMGSDLAVVHGCFAQIVLALLVTIAVLTSPKGAFVALADNARRPRIVRGAAILEALAFVQIVFGVMVRQTASPLGQRGHLLTAFAVLGVYTWLTKETLATFRGDRRMRLTLHVLGALLAVQLILGVEAWLSKFKNGTFVDVSPITLGSAALRTAHFFAGTMIFATAVTLLLMNLRRRQSAMGDVVVSSPRLEEAA
jgi:cytochrome c oxidase assembly protein subunit 15